MANQAKAGDLVQVHYTGRLKDGKQVYFLIFKIENWCENLFSYLKSLSFLTQRVQSR